MNSKLLERLQDLKARQENGTYKRCPRCGRDTMKEKLYTNALSRLADIMVCDECGMDEAKLAFMRSPGTLYQWAALQPKKPASDFKTLPGETVWKRICDEQATTITKLYHHFKDDGVGTDEIRFEAFESCPGLIQMWTEPYMMKYAAADGALVIRFTPTESGVEMKADLVHS